MYPWHNFEEQNNVLEYSINIINYCITINIHYNYIINAQENYYISNKGLLKGCDKAENVPVTAGDAASSL